MTKRVAVVVGGTGGIGSAACQALADEFSVISMARAGGNIKCDVTSRDSVESAFGSAWSLFGRIDVLVNAFGASPISSSTITTTDEAFLSFMDVDVLGCFHCCRQFLKYPSPAPRAIVNVSSYHALATYQNRVPYATAKAAVVGMTQALAVENPTVACNVMLPGQVDSPRSNRFLTDEQRSRIAAHGRIPDCREVGEVIAFLAKVSPWVMSGASIVVDGGWTRDASY